LRKTDEEIRVLAAVLQDIEKKEQGLAKALEQAKLNDSQEREKRRARVEALTSRRPEILAEVRRLEAELSTTQARLDAQQLQANVDAAEQQLWAVQQELVKTRAEIESLEREIKEIEEQLARKRSDYQTEQEEYDRLFEGMPPNKVLDALELDVGGRNPVLEKTLLEEIRRALGRKNIAYSDKEGALDRKTGEALDKLSDEELGKKQKKERERLDKIAKKVL